MKFFFLIVLYTLLFLRFRVYYFFYSAFTIGSRVSRFTKSTCLP